MILTRDRLVLWLVLEWSQSHVGLVLQVQPVARGIPENGCVLLNDFTEDAKASLYSPTVDLGHALQMLVPGLLRVPGDRGYKRAEDRISIQFNCIPWYMFCRHC